MAKCRVTLERIERGMAVVARAIRDNPRGQAAWPIFERLEAEREKLLNRERRLDEAIARVEHRQKA